MNDPRQRGKITYPLDEILLLCLLAVLAGAETMVDIALFGRQKLARLRRFRPFREVTRRMTIWATSLPPSTQSSSSAAWWPGSRP